jgi:O-methyltransferase
MLTEMKLFLKKILPIPVWNSLCYGKQLVIWMSFLLNQGLNVSLRDKVRILNQLYVINSNIDCPHAPEEIFSYIQTILSLPRNSRGVIVEAGCYKGGSTAKFSLAADIVGKELVIFDSFQGIPDNDELHERINAGGKRRFKKGEYCGSLEEVKANVSKYGNINCCRFVPGWFDDTLPNFKESISAIYLDVDLSSSTRTCLKYLYPLLEPGGVLYSQDAHLSLVINVFEDDNFWLSEVGCKRPQILGLGKKRLIKITKEAQHGVVLPHVANG